MKWTTRILKEMTEPYGVDEAHYACFLPKKWQGEGLVVSLLIPECELQADLPRPPGAEPAVFINRPSANQKVEIWLPLACEIAMRQGAALYFACDTAKQAEGDAARMASKLLPDHERVALERMYEPHTSERKPLFPQQEGRARERVPVPVQRSPDRRRDGR
jgi:hypothetical protein